MVRRPVPSKTLTAWAAVACHIIVARALPTNFCSAPSRKPGLECHSAGRLHEYLQNRNPDQAGGVALRAPSRGGTTKNLSARDCISADIRFSTGRPIIDCRCARDRQSLGITNFRCRTAKKPF